MHSWSAVRVVSRVLQGGTSSDLGRESCVTSLESSGSDLNQLKGYAVSERNGTVVCMTLRKMVHRHRRAARESVCVGGARIVWTSCEGLESV